MLKVAGPSRFFDYMLNDPTTPFLSKRVPLPKISDVPLNIEVIGFREGPLLQEDAIRIQAASVLYSIISTITWINSIRRIEKWAITDTLKVSPRAGKQFNAYYDRFGVHFFYEIHPVTKKTIFASDSAEAVNHEFGHAVLDSFRPDFWDLSNFETFCFHEAFGDIISMLSSMQHMPILEYVLQETNGDLLKSNTISRVAEELGNAICCKDPTNFRPQNCLRDAVEVFYYVPPDSLLSKCPFNVLCREAHNFSRIFSCAWYKLFVEIRNRYHKSDEIESFIIARDIMAKLTILCLKIMEKRKNLFESAARAIMQTDLDCLGGSHIDLIRRVFTSRNIIPCEILH